VPGAFLCHGFGSRGLLYAPLAAQLLADQILNLPELLPASLSSLFHEHLPGNT
jgi:glycine/D-amino acid oxidase-like deaminating enzyme